MIVSLTVLAGLIILCVLINRPESKTITLNIDSNQISTVACVNPVFSGERNVYVTDKEEIKNIVDMLNTASFVYKRKLQDGLFKKKTTGGFAQLLLLYDQTDQVIISFNIDIYDQTGQAIIGHDIDNNIDLRCVVDGKYQYICSLPSDSELKSIITSIVNEYWER